MSIYQRLNAPYKQSKNKVEVLWAEQSRSIVSTMPFVHYPKIFKLALITNAVTWLNMLPHTDGISDIWSPRVIVTGVIADFMTHCRVPIGSYCEIHEEPRPSNAPESPRTSPAIALAINREVYISYLWIQGKEYHVRSGQSSQWMNTLLKLYMIFHLLDLAIIEISHTFSLNREPTIS